MKIDKKVWEHPTSEYRGIPMWSWNGKLQPDILKEQLLNFRKMGFGGAEIHSRIGLETEYLGEEFMECVRACVDFAKENGMKIWLYDEDKWPSGFGAGRVTAEHPELACKYLLFSPNYYENGFHDRHKIFPTRVTGNGDLELLCTYRIRLRNGRLVSYDCEKGNRFGEDIWYLYLCTVSQSAWFHNGRYGDVLNPDAVKRFLDVAYEPYADAVGKEFGNTIPAVFTDEPCFYRMENLKDGNKAEDIGLPYTGALGRMYSEKYGKELLEQIPEIVWEWEEDVISPVRYRYHVCISELFTKAYGEQLGEWSRRHELLFTGHLLGENSLEEMTRSTGEIMYTLAQWDLPGCDMLANRHEYTTVKQAQSVVHQLGRQGVMCEIYGVTNWDFDFRGHKHMGDWLAALGVTARVPHLAWMTMKGEAKRDYPSPIDGHTTWYEKYPILEDYYARLKMVLESGVPIVHIAVIHPVESFWMQLGPDSTTLQKRRRLEEQYQQLAEWLLFDNLDFDYISEALLSRVGSAEKDGFHVGKMRYEVVIVPSLCTIRSSTLSLLEKFASKGGKVIMLGETPAYVDGCSDRNAEKAFLGFFRLGFDKWALIKALEESREVRICTAEGVQSSRFLCQMRQDGEDRYLFLAHGKEDNGLEYNLWSDAAEGEQLTVSVKGSWSVQLLDCENSRMEKMRSEIEGNDTKIQVRLYEHDSLLVRLSPAKPYTKDGGNKEDPIQGMHGKSIVTQYNLKGLADYSLREPNVLLLDQAEYSLDGEEWRDSEEILRMDDRIREELGYPFRNDSMPQPWVRGSFLEEHVVSLRFVINSRIDLQNVTLALENEKAEIVWNGKAVQRNNTGQYYVDRAMECQALGALRRGANILQISFPFGQDTDLEWCYLLGDFGVYLRGDQAVIDKKPEKIGFSDIVHQGFPFYGGTITYQIPIKSRGDMMELQVPEFQAVLMQAALDQGQMQEFYKAPYQVCFETQPDKEYLMELTAYGNRYNTFGQLHDCNRREEYYGPKTWRTKGKNWSYSYQLRPSGILVPPVVKWRCENPLP